MQRECSPTPLACKASLEGIVHHSSFTERPGLIQSLVRPQKVAGPQHKAPLPKHQ